METALMITVVIAFVAALIAMLLTIWDCDFKWVKIFLSIAAISTIGMIIVVTIKVMMSDAPDLSSGVQKWTCGFESHSSY